nr:hypothetical protein 225 - Autographa californica nuclear polyhedrosis virus [Autographa californica nucleopolyhedrovirus]
MLFYASVKIARDARVQFSIVLPQNVHAPHLVGVQSRRHDYAVRPFVFGRVALARSRGNNRVGVLVVIYLLKNKTS